MDLTNYEKGLLIGVLYSVMHSDLCLKKEMEKQDLKDIRGIFQKLIYD